MSRWLIETAAGLWVGRPSARIRDHLWDVITGHADTGTAVMITADDSETGADIRIHGSHDRVLVDLDGLTLTARLPHTTAPSTS
jgi:CRISPR-associated protein Cas2